MNIEIKNSDEIGLQPNKRPISSFKRFSRPMTPINISLNCSNDDTDDQPTDSQEIKIDI